AQQLLPDAHRQKPFRGGRQRFLVRLREKPDAHHPRAGLARDRLPGGPDEKRTPVASASTTLLASLPHRAEAARTTDEYRRRAPLLGSWAAAELARQTSDMKIILFLLRAVTIGP